MPKKLDAMKLNLSRPGTLSPHHGEGRGVSGITKPSKLKYEISSSYLFKYDIVPPNISHTETSKNVSPLTLSLISLIGHFLSLLSHFIQVICQTQLAESYKNSSLWVFTLWPYICEQTCQKLHSRSI